MSNLLYDLLPGIYRELDDSGSMSLQALLQVIEDQRLALVQDTADLYEDWFIETCHESAIPPIAALLGLPSHGVSRTAVANTIACRRRKGTIAALETRIADVSGWSALATFQPVSAGTHIATASPALIIEIWRQPVFPVERATPRLVGPRRYSFHPMGIDIPLFQSAITNYSIERPNTSENMPSRILPTSSPDLQTSLSVSSGDLEKVPYRIVFGDLTLWNSEPPVFDPSSRIAIVDPLSGRLYLPEEQTQSQDAALPSVPPRISVDYAYAFSADLGGGPYPRQLSAPDQAGWIAFVHRRVALDTAPAQFFSNLEDAVSAFRQHPGSGTIRILDSSIYTLPDRILDATTCPPPGSERRTLTIEAQSGEVPCLTGTLRLFAAAPGQNVILNGLWIDGSIELGGDLTLDLHHCTVRPIASDTLTTGADKREGSKKLRARRGIRALTGDQPNLRVSLSCTIAGPIHLPANSLGLSLEDSIVDSIAGPESTLSDPPTPTPAPPTVLLRTTVLDSVLSVELRQTDSLIGSEYTREDTIFLSRRNGDPDYARLRPDAPVNLLCGASNGSEKGAFNNVGQPHRLAQLHAAIAEFVPDGIPSKTVFQS
jgi:hypothetical protein